jgi:uncharacterized DUF497 family protein
MKENDIYYFDGFEWDEGNSDKNWFLHQVTNAECEETFFNIPLIVADDTKHSVTEKRYYILGQTDRGRSLFIAFTIRGNLIRVISARDMNIRESRRYEKYAKRYSNF